jgi:hypothetical protein
MASDRTFLIIGGEMHHGAGMAAFASAPGPGETANCEWRMKTILGEKRMFLFTIPGIVLGPNSQVLVNYGPGYQIPGRVATTKLDRKAGLIVYVAEVSQRSAPGITFGDSVPIALQSECHRPAVEQAAVADATTTPQLIHDSSFDKAGFIQCITTACEEAMDASIDVAVVLGVELRQRVSSDVTRWISRIDMTRTTDKGLLQTEKDGDSFFQAVKQGAIWTLAVAVQRGIQVPTLAEIADKSVMRLRAQFVAYLYVEQNRMVIDQQGRRGILRSIVALQVRDQLQVILQNNVGDALGILRTCLRQMGGGQYSSIISLATVYAWVNDYVDTEDWLVDDHFREIPESVHVLFALGLQLLGQRYWPVPECMFPWVAEVHGFSLRVVTWDRRLGRRHQDRVIMQPTRPWLHLQQMVEPYHYAAIYVRSYPLEMALRADEEEYWLIDDDAIARCEMDWMARQGHNDSEDDNIDEGWSVGEADGWMTYDDLDAQMAEYEDAIVEQIRMEDEMLMEIGAI